MAAYGSQQFLGSVDRLSLAKVLKSYPVVRQAFGNISAMTLLLKDLQGSLLKTGLILVRPDEQAVTQQNPPKRTGKSPDDDRVFPLDTVDLQQFRLKHDTDIENATIHTGPYANELARSFSALAVTVGTDIYFRDRGYNPGSEEGRKTMAHELMHVAQHEAGEVLVNSSIEELEQEASRAEGKESPIEDPIIVLNLNGSRYRFPKSKSEYYARKMAEKTEEWLH